MPRCSRRHRSLRRRSRASAGWLLHRSRRRRELDVQHVVHVDAHRSAVRHRAPPDRMLSLNTGYVARWHARLRLPRPPHRGRRRLSRNNGNLTSAASAAALASTSADHRDGQLYYDFLADRRSSPISAPAPVSRSSTRALSAPRSRARSSPIRASSAWAGTSTRRSVSTWKAATTARPRPTSATRAVGRLRYTLTDNPSNNNISAMLSLQMQVRRGRRRRRRRRRRW